MHGRVLCALSGCFTFSSLPLPLYYLCQVSHYCSVCLASARQIVLLFVFSPGPLVLPATRISRQSFTLSSLRSFSQWVLRTEFSSLFSWIFFLPLFLVFLLSLSSRSLFSLKYDFCSFSDWSSCHPRVEHSDPGLTLSIKVYLLAPTVVAKVCYPST